MGLGFGLGLALGLGLLMLHLRHFVEQLLPLEQQRLLGQRLLALLLRDAHGTSWALAQLRARRELVPL